MEVNDHIISLNKELAWLENVIHQSISSYLLHEGHEKRWFNISLPQQDNGAYGTFLKEKNLSQYERLILILSLAPALKPEVLDVFFGKNQMYDRNFTEFGGAINNEHSGFLPTLQTLKFLITAVNPELNDHFLDCIKKTGVLRTEGIIHLSAPSSIVPFNNQILNVDNRWVQYFTTGEMPSLVQSESFPAHKISTGLDWEDIVLGEEVIQQISEMNSWLDYGDEIMDDWGLKKMIKPGYRALFYGPPGTGKTLTATLLGKVTKRDVYRIDLSMIVSKYIGETEKNLAKVFDIAEHKKWILFFDEADSLFGKRTNANSSNDRHANQQTGYLLQRIESFPGIIILASNLKENIDPAFSRRFQSMIHFKMPSVEERFQLWRNAFSGKCQLDPSIDLYKLAEDYELAGGAIINVLRTCALLAVKRNDTVVNKSELLIGLRKEFMKEHKTIINTL